MNIVRIVRLGIAALITPALAGCGSMTLPAAVKLDSGEAMIGTTTAAVSGGTFVVNDPAGSVGCSGTYDALDTRPVISAPFRCSDGRYGTITVLRTPDGRGGSGTVAIAGGGNGRVAFGDQAAGVLQSSPAVVAAAAPSYSSASTGRIYTGNCPTPDSLDAAGHRCGARSAASRPGGYDGYGSWASSGSSSGGSTYVSGYFRKNGTYVRSYYRRR